MYTQQKVIREINSQQFALQFQEAILQGLRVTRNFNKPALQYVAILTDDTTKTLQVDQKVDYQQTLTLRDTNPLHFALKLQQAILKGYRIKSGVRFGKLGVVWQATLEIGKGQLEELLKEQEVAEVKADVVAGVEQTVAKPESTDSKPTSQEVNSTEVKPQTPKKRTTKQSVNKEQ